MMIKLCLDLLCTLLSSNDKIISQITKYNELISELAVSVMVEIGFSHHFGRNNPVDRIFQ